METFQATLAYDDTTNIVVGNKNTDSIITIKYSAIRTYFCQVGEISILNKDSSLEIVHKNNYDECGLIFTTDFNSNDIRLNIAVDDSLIVDIDFNYTIQIIKK